MSVRISTNIVSLEAQRNLQKTRAEEEQSTLKIASGERILSAADDAAGLSIATKLTAESRSLNQTVRNAMDGISLLQVAEGGLKEIQNILVRLRELSVQAATDTISNRERGFINTEVQSLSEEITRIAKSTKYQNRKLLEGGMVWPVLDLQIGTDNTSLDRISINRNKMDATLEHIGLFGINFSTKSQALEFIPDLDQAIQYVSSYRAKLGAKQNELVSIIENQKIKIENTDQTKSRILDTDMAQETSNRVQKHLLSLAGTSVLSQANVAAEIALKLIDSNSN